MVLQDPFGNYVVQYVLELGHVEATATIMRQLYGQYPELAQQKFSSNVVEKCLKLGGPGLAECRERVIRELMVSPLLPRLLQVCVLIVQRSLMLLCLVKSHHVILCWGCCVNSLDAATLCCLGTMMSAVLWCVSAYSSASEAVSCSHSVPPSGEFGYRKRPIC